jgi:hypothetical protein
MTVPTPALNVSFGQTLGEAYRNAHDLQLRLLDSEGSSFLEWVVLNITSASDSPIARDELCNRLTGEFLIDPSAVDSVVSVLLSNRHIDEVTANGHGHLELTDDGRVYHQRLRARVNKATAELMDGIDPGDLAVTVRVLLNVRDRAPSISV